MKFRAEFLLPVVVLSAALLYSAPASAQETPALTITPALSQWFRPGCGTPVAITIQTGKAPLAGSLHIITDTTELRLQVDLPVSCTRVFHFVVTPAADPVVRAQLVSGGIIAAEASAPLKKLAPGGRLALLLGRSQGQFAPLIEQMPASSVLTRVAVDALPQDYHGYEAVDLLIVSDFSTEPSKLQRQALTQWLYGGGSMLFVMPANGFGIVNDFWRRFLPSPLLDDSFKIRSFPQDSNPGGIRIFNDPLHAGLTGFYAGAGRVLLASYGQTPETATADARRQLAGAIVGLLTLQKPAADRPLFDPQAYDLFEKQSWPAGVRRTLWMAAVGYVLVMIVIVTVLSREKPLIFGAATACFSAAFAAIIYFAILPASTTILQSVTSVYAVPGASAARVTQYRYYSSASDAPIAVAADQPLRPVFYSNRMLRNGPVAISKQHDRWHCTVVPGSGKPPLFRHDSIVPFGGSLSVAAAKGGFSIYNSLTDTATSRPIELRNVILTDGTRAVFIDSLPHRKSISVPFDAAAAANLTRLVWDKFAQSRPRQHTILKNWLNEHPPTGQFYLLGWSSPGIIAAPRQNLLNYAPQPTFWQIRIPE